MKKSRVLYFFVGESTFVKKDIDILSKNFDVKSFNFEVNPSAKWMIVFVFLRQFFFLLLNTFSSKLMVCQFSGYHSFLPALIARLTGKKSLVVAAGMDTVSFPSIGYGNFSKPMLGLFTRWTYKLCSHVAPKHETLWLCKYDYTKDDFPEQGIKHFIPELDKPYTVIHNGYDAVKFSNKSLKKEKTFITVTGAMEYSFQKALKGIDLLLQVAPYFPDYKFVIIGVLSENQFKDISKNVVLLTKVPNEKLIDLYSTSEFYFQLSMAEGFPNAICEAMLCECVPIGSNVFSIPDIIGDTGFILKERNLQMLINLILHVIAADTASLGKKARERIANNFSLAQREEKLTKLIKELIGNQN